MNQTVRIYGELKDELTSRKFAFKPVFDGNLFRFDRNGKVGSAWAVGKTATSAGKPIQMLMFGDFATGESYEWWSRKALTKEEAKELAVQAGEERKKYQKIKKQKQQDAAKESREFWSNLPERASPTGYGLRKGLYELYGARPEGEDLYVPIHTANGTLCNLQRIEADGTKRFWPGGAIRGNAFFVNGYPEKAPSTIYLAEGYSTGASIFEALRSRPSAARSPEEIPQSNKNRPEHGGISARASDLEPPRRSDLSHASGMAQNAADDTTKDGGIPQAPRSYRCGNKDAGTQTRARSQGRRPTRADHRARLEHQLLAAISPTHAQSRTNAGARPGGAQGLHQIKSTQGDPSLEVRSPRQGDGRGGLSRPRQDSGSDGPKAYGLAQPAALELPAIHHGQPGGDQRGDEALPGSFGSNPFPIHRGNGPGAIEGCIKFEPRSAGDEQRGNASLSPEGCAIVQRFSSGIGRGLEARGSRGISEASGADRQGSPRAPVHESGIPATGRTGEAFSGREDSLLQHETAESSEPLRERSALRGDGHGVQPTAARGSDFIVACALNAGNLKPVAEALAKRYPAARFIICGDDDRHTTKPDGSAWNPGREAALEAARSVGGLVSFPQFDELELVSPVSDYNDLSLLPNGHARVLASLEDATTPEIIEAAAKLHQSIAAMRSLPQLSIAEAHQAAAKEQLIAYGPKGGVVFPTPQFLADHIIETLGNTIVKQDGNIFRYRDTHWRHLDQHGLDDLSMYVQELLGGEGNPAKLDEYIEMLRRTLQSPPRGRNLFSPDPYLANFQNGTLHLVKNCTRHYTEFRPHSIEDYATNMLPYTYAEPENLPTNILFEEMLGRIFEGDVDASQKRRAVRQMFGACLLPMSPHLFMLWGPPGTGKSSLIKLAARLVHPDNACSVDPSEFTGFNLEIMAGKLVNCVTDINTAKPIQDAIIKRINDRVAVTIKRKYEKDLFAPLPAIHIFGANKIPPTLDGEARAHTRRWTFIEFSKVFVTGKEDLFFVERVFDSCPLGILKFALEGLRDLIASEGHFLQPDSGKAKIEDWQRANDPVGIFVQAIKEGEVLGDSNTRAYLSKEEAVSRTKLYELFRCNSEAYAPDNRVMPAHEFYERIKSMGFRLKIVRGARLIEGIAIGVGTGAHC